MKTEQHELYEYARKRIKQKRIVYFHFVLLFLASLFLFVATKAFNFNENVNWHIWLITAWLFIFILHFVKVFITDRFMNKKWEREQIDRLVALQEKKISELNSQIDEDSTTN